MNTDPIASDRPIHRILSATEPSDTYEDGARLFHLDNGGHDIEIIATPSHVVLVDGTVLVRDEGPTEDYDYTVWVIESVTDLDLGLDASGYDW